MKAYRIQAFLLKFFLIPLEFPNTGNDHGFIKSAADHYNEELNQNTNNKFAYFCADFQPYKFCFNFVDQFRK